MKIIYAFVLVVLAACNTKEKKTGITGAYKMLYQRLQNENTDTTYMNLQQLKIFTDKYMMYTNFNTPDSASSFGIGSYEMHQDTVTENVIYSASDTTKDVDGATYKLLIEKTPKGFRQVIHNITMSNQTYTLYEEYQSVGMKETSALDGAWRAIKSFTIDGTDTTDTDIPRFKVYWAGHIMWGHTFSDSLNVNHTGIGYGTFQLDGNKLKEMIEVSTYHDIRGHDFDIDIEMNGTDEFKQTINQPEGTKSVEIYYRLK